MVNPVIQQQPRGRSRSTTIMGVVADDITGSNDIGIMFALSGYDVCVYPSAKGIYSDSAPDICILNTNSRLDDPETAYEKVFQATLALKDAGCTQFFNKTCSVFRGNIGAEFDAMLDALERNFAVVVLGYPKNGRTTINGIHYVHGKPLNESEFRCDPIHPMTQSNLVDILQSQSRRKVELMPGAVIDQGSQAMLDYFEQKKRTCSYLIVDVREQADLSRIAESVKDEPVLCGSSALAEFLPHAWKTPGRTPTRPEVPTDPGLGVLCISGSLMPQTAEQVKYLIGSGGVEVILDPAIFLQNQDSPTELATRIAAELRSGKDVVFHAGTRSEDIDHIRAAGKQAGLSRIQIARRVSHALADIGIRSLQAAGQNRLIAAGGETSDAVCSRLAVSGLRIHQEIEPGLPSCVTLTTPTYLLVLKSGSFGTPAFLNNAVHHLKNTPNS
jgi:uncharacterized protein YgbK (DUF1537 family)